MLIFKRSHTHINESTLSEYLDGRMQGSAAVRVDRLLANCATCQQELDSLRSTVSLLRQMPEAPISRSFTFPSPPPVVAAARPAMPLRMPQWVYAGAAGVAALVLAVLVSADATGVLAPDAGPAVGDMASLAAPATQALSVERAEAVVAPAAAPDEAVSLAASPEVDIDVAVTKQAVTKEGESNRALALQLQQSAELPAGTADQKVESDVSAAAAPVAAKAVAEQRPSGPAAAMEPTPEASEATGAPTALEERSGTQRELVPGDAPQQTPQQPETPISEANLESQATAAPAVEPVATAAVWRLLEGLAAGALVAIVAGWLIRRWKSTRYTGI